MGVRQPHLSVVQISSNTETVDTLKRLLQEANEGKLTGLVYAAMHREEGYSADIVGRARSFPVMALGILHFLQDRVTQLIS